ncbi:MAG TPA: hypothetical protein GXX23_03225 [Firmicutes bacterium]|nr:hypothetical protein [Candidatus Fermentithermobacillaceae bacterium]
MERLLRTCVAMLVVSLLLIAYSGVRINSMARELQELRNNSVSAGSQQLQNLQLELASLRSALQELQQASQWATPVDISIGERQGEIIPITLSWQIKELAEGSAITLYLKRDGDVDYTAYEASGTGGGGYRVVMEYPYRLNPEINVGITQTYSKPGQHESIRAESLIGYSEDRFDYYISASGGGQLKTTEVGSFDLAKVGSLEAGPLSVEIHRDDGDLRVTVSEEPQLIRRFRPTKASFQIVSGDSKTTLPLSMSAKPQDDFRKFEGEVKNAPQAVDHYVLILEYSDGNEIRTVEKVIRSR